jgi:hypothetical protein
MRDSRREIKPCTADEPAATLRMATERVTAVIDPNEEIEREAAVAQRHILETGARMRKRVATYARDLADRYLARFGYTYDSWIAAVGHGPTPALAARARSIERALFDMVAARKRSRRGTGRR